MSRRLQTIVSTGEITQKMQNIKKNCLAESKDCNCAHRKLLSCKTGSHDKVVGVVQTC